MGFAIALAGTTKEIGFVFSIGATASRVFGLGQQGGWIELYSLAEPIGPSEDDFVS